MSQEMPFCPRCPHPTQDQDIRVVIDQVIQSLPPEQRTPEAEYALRLQGCEDCPGQMAGVCRYCGCYVEVRAAKNFMICPNPKGSRWPANSTAPADEEEEDW